MDPTTARRVTGLGLLMLSLAALSSGHEMIERLRNRHDGLSLSGCLVNCEAGLLDCSLSCFLETPLKCLANCFLAPGLPDPSTCSQQCTDSVMDCLQDCGDSPSPSPPDLQLAPGPLSPFHPPVLPV